MQPRRVITSPEWSGIDEEGRAYAAFTINVEHDKPWHTLSGACTSTSITRGCSSSARACPPTGRRSTTG